MPGPTLITAAPDSEFGERALRAYMREIVSRYWRRQATQAEVNRALREYPADDLTPPSGVFVVAVQGAEPIACGGMRLLDDGVAELTRIWVTPAQRRHGLGTRIVEHLEGEARAHERTRIHLDTRSDLTEARALYARLGYVEVEPFNRSPYVEHWFEKTLG